MMIKLEKKPTVKGVQKTIKTIDKLLELEKKKKEKMIELKKQLIRIERALNEECWASERKWKKLTIQEKTKIFQNELCVRFQSSGSIFQDLREFPFFATKQWEKDRAQLIREGKIKPELKIKDLRGNKLQ